MHVTMTRQSCIQRWVAVLAPLAAGAGLAIADSGRLVQPYDHATRCQFDSTATSVRVVMPMTAYTVTDRADGQFVAVEGFGRLLVPGKPNLPSKIFAVAVPPGAEVVGVTYDTGQGVVLPGTYEVAPTRLAREIGQEEPAALARRQAVCDRNFEAVYGSDDPYPAQPVELVRTAGYREYNLADVRVTPLVYRPRSGVLVYYPEITFEVHYRLPERAADVVVERQPRTERVARDLLLNYEQAQAWYPQVEGDGRGLHDFVIITTSSLVSSVTSLVDWETAKGRNAYVVTMTWIDANYSGVDLAQKIRNFLRDKYPSGQWGIEDVLLVGDPDMVAMRRVAQDLGYGEPETDYYYAELSLPDDQSWDADGDYAWAEDSDPIDFYAEVNVGRIPWSTASVVSSICQKSVAYEQNDAPGFKKNMLLLGGFFWNDDPNPRTDNAVLMETKVDQSWMADWTFTRMYEQNSTCYSTYPCDYELLRSNVVPVWSGGTFAFVNWGGHGSPTSAHIYGLGAPAFIASSDCSSLNDAYPAIVFADSCSNSDTDYTNIGQSMLQQGAVGFVGATKVALGCPGWSDVYDGSSQSMDYLFTTSVTTGEYTQGQAHQYALREMYTNGLWDYQRYEACEWGALWGNPNLGMAAPASLRIEFPDGLPETVDPGVPTVISVQITELADTCVPGSPTLHYRYDGGTYLTSPLASLGGDRYEAALPAAACDDVPEYFFAAEGASSGIIYSPSDAPATVYSLVVGTLAVTLDDDFETDQGWTVGDVGDDATTGIWGRSDPEPTDAQPGDDHTPAPGTLCWVTDGRGGSLGDYDVDGGKTTLKSPVMNLAGLADATVSYYRWYSNNTGATPGTDVFVVDISNNGGASWVNVETVGPSGAGTTGGWLYHEFQVADFVTPTAQVRMRFIASDEGDGSLVEAAVDDLLVTSFECVPPAECVATGAQSCRDHAAAGRLCVDLVSSSGIESRLGGAVELEMTVDDAAGFSGGVTVTCVNAGDVSGYVSGTSVNGDTVTVTFAPALPDQDACTVELDCGASVCVRSLAGDVDFSGLVTPGDASIVKPRFGAVPDASLVRFDVDASGLITPGDFSQVKPKFGHAVPVCP